METTAKPTQARHHQNEDGTETVEYFVNGELSETITYATRQEGSIESMLKLFPGTSRSWLESMYAEPARPTPKNLPTWG